MDCTEIDEDMFRNCLLQFQRYNRDIKFIKTTA